jgi:hypothetical protein
MRIMVSGWGRNVGKTEIMNAAIGESYPEPQPGDRYARGNTYLKVLYPENRRLTKVRVSTSTEVRLGGTYLLEVELSRNEIAQLFYETHGGDIVRMFRSFIEDEERQHDLQRLGEWAERRRQRLKKEEQPG